MTSPVLLVLRHHGLGDLLTVQPALRGLRRRFPDHKLFVTCPSWLVPLARRLGGADVYVSERSRPPKGRPAAAVPANHQDVDVAMLANVLKTVPTVDILVSLRTPGPELMPIVDTLRPAQIVSYRFESMKETHEYPELDFSDHILRRWERLLAGLHVVIDTSDLYIDPKRFIRAMGHTVVHIGAGSPARRWPQERWVKVVRYLESHGHHVILTGSAEERDRVAQVRTAAELPAEREASSSDDIIDLMMWVAGARLVVCADSGISHVATALRRPALTLFGPVPPAWWGPPPGNPQHKTLWMGTFGDNYASTVDRGLLAISPDMVLGTIETMAV